MKYLARLSVYKFSRKKMKCDYSIIPVEIKEGKVYSQVSKETLDYKGEKWFNRKEHSFKEICIIFNCNDFEAQEDFLRRQAIKEFKKHFIFSFKHKKFLDKKISYGQL